MTKLLHSIKNIPVYENAEDAFSLEYSVVDGSSYSGEYKSEQYGIEVSKYREFDGILFSETKTLENITGQKRSVIRLIKLISENSVTPFVLQEIVDEIKCDDRFNDIFELRA